MKTVRLTYNNGRHLAVFDDAGEQEEIIFSAAQEEVEEEDFGDYVLDRLLYITQRMVYAEDKLKELQNKL